MSSSKRPLLALAAILVVTWLGTVPTCDGTPVPCVGSQATYTSTTTLTACGLMNYTQVTFSGITLTVDLQNTVGSITAITFLCSQCVFSNGGLSLSTGTTAATQPVSLTMIQTTFLGTVLGFKMEKAFNPLSNLLLDGVTASGTLQVLNFGGTLNLDRTNVTIRNVYSTTAGSFVRFQAGMVLLQSSVVFSSMTISQSGNWLDLDSSITGGSGSSVEFKRVTVAAGTVTLGATNFLVGAGATLHVCSSSAQLANLAVNPAATKVVDTCDDAISRTHSGSTLELSSMTRSTSGVQFSATQSFSHNGLSTSQSVTERLSSSLSTSRTTTTSTSVSPSPRHTSTMVTSTFSTIGSFSSTGGSSTSSSSLSSSVSANRTESTPKTWTATKSHDTTPTAVRNALSSSRSFSLTSPIIPNRTISTASPSSSKAVTHGTLTPTKHFTATAELPPPPPPPPPPVTPPAVPEVITTATTTAAQTAVVASVLSSNPTSATDVMRILMLQSILECTLSLDVSEGLDMFSWKIGTGDGKVARGIVLGNFLTVAGFMLLIALVATALWRVARTPTFSWTDAAAVVRAPSVGGALASAFLQPTMVASTALCSLPDPAATDWVFVLLGFVTGVGFTVWVSCVMLHRFPLHCVEETHNNSHFSLGKEPKAAAGETSRADDAHRASPTTLAERWWTYLFESQCRWVHWNPSMFEERVCHSNIGGLPQAQGMPLATSVAVGHDEAAANTAPHGSPCAESEDLAHLQALLLGPDTEGRAHYTGARNEIAPLPNTSARDRRIHRWYLSHQLVFDDYRVTWFPVMDLWCAVAVGIATGTPRRSASICYLQAVLFLVNYVVLLVALVVFRTIAVRLLLWLSLAICAVGAVSSTALLVYVVSPEKSDKSIVVVQYGALLMSIIASVKSLVDLLQLAKTFRVIYHSVLVARRTMSRHDGVASPPTLLMVISELAASAVEPSHPYPQSHNNNAALSSLPISSRDDGSDVIELQPQAPPIAASQLEGNTAGETAQPPPLLPSRLDSLDGQAEDFEALLQKARAANAQQGLGSLLTVDGKRGALPSSSILCDAYAADALL